MNPEKRGELAVLRDILGGIEQGAYHGTAALFRPQSYKIPGLPRAYLARQIKTPERQLRV